MWISDRMKYQKYRKKEVIPTPVSYLERTLIKRTNLAYNTGRMKACSPKTRYSTLQKAEESGTRINMSGRNGNKKIVPYYCPFCRKWHLGNYSDDTSWRIEMTLPESIKQEIRREIK